MGRDETGEMKSYREPRMVKFWVGYINGEKVYECITDDPLGQNKVLYHTPKPFFLKALQKAKKMMIQSPISSSELEVLKIELDTYYANFLDGSYVHNNYGFLSEPEAIKFLYSTEYDYSKHLDVFKSEDQARFELRGYFEYFRIFCEDLLNYLKTSSHQFASHSSARSRGQRKVSEKGAWANFEANREAILNDINEFLVEKRKFIDREYVSVLCELLNKQNSEVVIPWYGTAEMLNAFLTGIKANPNFMKGQVWNHFKGNFKYKGRGDVWVNTAQKNLRQNSGYDPEHPLIKKIIEFGKSL